ncbi:hypothetical protein SNEBB_006980 [Seison nebaliae]|nr:hypothetical protein SNEBB_006980 [Seison nebaliae]
MNNRGYDDTSLSRSASAISRQTDDVGLTDHEKKNKGCCSKLKNCFYSIWSTNLMKDTSQDKELYIRTTLRELIIYCCYLAVLLVITFGMTNTTMYNYTKVLNDLFIGTKNSKGAYYADIAGHDDYYTYLEEQLLNGIYWENWYNGDPIDVTDKTQAGFIYFENKVLGVPRIRQLKVRDGSCEVPNKFEDVILHCFGQFSKKNMDKAKFRIGANECTDLDEGFCFHSETELDGSSHSGIISSYPGDGYVATLKKTKAESKNIIDHLKANRWIDRGTRAVFVDFTVYNANVNLFCQIRLLLEFPAMGGAFPSHTFRTVKLIRYVSTFDYFVLACELIYALFLLYYTIEEIIEIKKHKCEYFKSFCNVLDIVILLIGYVAIAFSVFRFFKVNEVLDSILKNEDKFMDFEFLGFWQTQFNNAVAAAVFLSWIKIFKYISFNKTMTQLSSTLGRCAKDVVGFSFMFFIVFFAFAQLGFLIFGTQLKDFSTFSSSLFTLFRIILGDFDFYGLQSANRSLGPLFFILYVFFVYLILLNMFLAIINDTYSGVKEEISVQDPNNDFADYFRSRYNKMLDKMNIKRDRIMDIQEALKSADVDSDANINYEEWRTDLKSRGFADAEIEAMFAKYDVDGDRVLSQKEQELMKEDLQKQRDALNAEFDDAKAKESQIGEIAEQVDKVDKETPDDKEPEVTVVKRRGRHLGDVGYEEYNILQRRVDRMENSVQSIVTKIHSVLYKLETMERSKMERREIMSKILNQISEQIKRNGNAEDWTEMEELVRGQMSEYESRVNSGK